MADKEREWKLKEISLELQSWVDFNEADRTINGFVLDEDKHVMLPPVWPTIGVLKEWIKILTDGEDHEPI